MRCVLKLVSKSSGTVPAGLALVVILAPALTCRAFTCRSLRSWLCNAPFCKGVGMANLPYGGTRASISQNNYRKIARCIRNMRRVRKLVQGKIWLPDAPGIASLVELGRFQRCGHFQKRALYLQRHGRSSWSE